MASLLMGRCRELRIEPPAPKQENVQLSSFGRRFHPVVSASGDPADMVAGTLFEIAAAELAAAELAAADSYEVAEYRRVPARLASGADAWVYVKA
ncbi:hypothetical protein ABMY26_31560 [Azospirillum sp. HJ39]|uniref:hypothetical protein n=1 Tax=Azospirillum sp. HJ39 TaxID=3159496 RepID=UPI003559031C